MQINDAKYQYKTDRLIIRYYSEKDFILWQNLFSDMYKKQNQWDWECEKVNQLSKKRFRAKLARHCRERQEGKVFYFCVEFEKKLVGIGLIKKIEDWSVEFGFQINNKYWGRGFGKELAMGLFTICLKQITCKNIIAKVNTKNTFSMYILESMNMAKSHIEKDSLEYIFRL